MAFYPNDARRTEQTAGSCSDWPSQERNGGVAITSARKLLTNRSYGVSYHLCSG